MCGSAEFYHLLRGQAIHRRAWDFHQRQVDVYLAAMVSLVFDHRAQPLPRCDGTSRRRTFTAELVRGEAGKNFYVFTMQAFRERDDLVVSCREIFTAAGIGAGLASGDLDEDVPVGGRDMPH